LGEKEKRGFCEATLDWKQRKVEKVKVISFQEFQVRGAVCLCDECLGYEIRSVYPCGKRRLVFWCKRC